MTGWWLTVYLLLFYHLRLPVKLLLQLHILLRCLRNLLPRFPGLLKIHYNEKTFTSLKVLKLDKPSTYCLRSSSIEGNTFLIYSLHVPILKTLEIFPNKLMG